MTSRDDPLITHPTGFTWPVKIVAAFMLLQLTVATIRAFRAQNQEFFLYILLVVLGLWVLSLLHRRIRFSVPLLACLSLLLLFHMAGGLVEIPRSFKTEGPKFLYNWWLIKPYLKYDNLVHGFGSAVATWFCWQLLQRTVASRSGWAFRDLTPTVELMLFCILSAQGMGALNEVVEFYSSRFAMDSNVGSYVNNSVDLVANAAGSFFAAAILRIYYHFHRKL